MKKIMILKDFIEENIKIIKQNCENLENLKLCDLY